MTTNNILEKISLIKHIRMWGVIMLISLTTVIIGVNFTINYADFTKQAQKSRNVYAEHQKSHAMREVMSIVDLIRYDIKKMGSGEYKTTNDRVKSFWLDRINHIRFGENGNGYIFAISWEGGCSIAHGSMPELIGQCDLLRTDSRGNLTTQKMVDISKTENGGFVDYWWPKPSTGEEAYKVVFSMGIPEWGVLIAGGVYMDDIEVGVDILREELYIHMMMKVIATISSTFFAFIFFTSLFNRFNSTLRKDLDLFVEFFHKASISNTLIDRNNIQFVELDRIASVANKMLVDRVQIDESLVETVKLLTESQRITSIGSWTIDCKTEKLTWSDETYKIFGVKRGFSSYDLFDRFKEVIHPEDREEALYLYQISLESKVPYKFAHRIVRDGEIRNVVESCETTYDENGVPLKSMGTVQDVTERIIAEEEHKKLESQLQQAQKMEAIGTLAGGIAHDFNNILSVIIGYAELSKTNTPNNSDIYKNLNTILEASGRATSLVKQILSFSRQNETESILIQPASIVNNAITMLRPTLPSTIEFTSYVDKNTQFIFVDPTKIHQIVMNLCTNAFHAMEDNGGTLDIRVKGVTLVNEDLTRYSGVVAGDFIRISVADSGVGMTQDIIDRVFEPYFTTKKVGKGTGMGLSIVHGIVQSYGGFISVYSEVGIGSAFHIFIPTVGKTKMNTTNITETVPVGIERILFVDDVEILVTMGKQLLDSLGYQVTATTDPLDALVMFSENPDSFDAVVTDQTMPHLTGAELSVKLLEIRPDIPIILCTGYSSIMSAETAKNIGIREFVLKPITKKDIAVLLRKVLDN